MPTEPTTKRTIAFIDGQNLFYSVKNSFGYQHPNYDVKLLAESICVQNGWELTASRFYTGVPTIADNAFWHNFWNKKLRAMQLQGISVTRRPLKYRIKTIRSSDGTIQNIPVGDEKGIDVRIALDMVRLTRKNLLDVVLLFSQDQDLAEAVEDVKLIAREQSRWVKVACAFPKSSISNNRRGINDTDWKPIGQATYDACIDPRDYR